MPDKQQGQAPNLIAMDRDADAATGMPAPSTQPAEASGQSGATSGRKVILTGQINYDVKSFEVALASVREIVQSVGGSVATVNSSQLPGGRVEGTVTLRVPPASLDVTVEKLRAIGQLRSQNLGSEDVGMKYTDFESQLRAARTMQDRLLEIIKTSEGKVKDVLEAERELNRVSEKIETIQGTLRYFDHQVAMATLTLTLSERGESPGVATDLSAREMIRQSVMTQDAPAAYRAILDKVKALGGRILSSGLDQSANSAGGGTIDCEIPREKLQELTDAIAQFGPDLSRSSTRASDGDTTTDAKVRLTLTFGMIATILPRDVVEQAIASDDVRSAYQSILAFVKASSGRVIVARSNDSTGVDATAYVDFEIPREKVDEATSRVNALGHTLTRQVNRTPDAQQATDAKAQFKLALSSSFTIPARESLSLSTIATDVASTYQAWRGVLQQSGARVTDSVLSQRSDLDRTAALEFDLPALKLQTILDRVGKDAQILSRQSQRRPDTERALDDKVHVRIDLAAAGRLVPSAVTQLMVQARDPDAALMQAQTLATRVGGSVKVVSRSRGEGGMTQVQATVDVPAGRRDEVSAELSNTGQVRSSSTSRNANVPEGPLTQERFQITWSTETPVVASDSGLVQSVRQGLTTSVAGLLWSLKTLVIGLCLIGPWAVVGYVIWRVRRRNASGGQKEV